MNNKTSSRPMLNIIQNFNTNSKNQKKFINNSIHDHNITKNIISFGWV